MMVKRWAPMHKYMVDTQDLDMEGEREYVLYSDYLALQKALEGALKGWHVWTDYVVDPFTSEKDRIRISQLRSLYLRGEAANPRDENWYKDETGKFG
jgi:hypothetical protein